jgi:hypothetical protein
MVVRAQIGYSPHMGIFVLWLSFFLGLLLFFSNVIDALLVLFPVGVDHWSSVAMPRVTFWLHVPILFAVAAHNVRNARAIAACRARGRAASLHLVGVAERLLTMHRGDMLNVLVLQFVPEDGGDLLRLHRGLESSNLLGVFVVIVDGLNFMSKLHALLECCLAGLQDSVVERVLDAGQKELMLEEQGHVVYSFGLHLGLGGIGGDGAPDGGHGAGLVIDEAVIGDLDPASEVVH